MTMLGAGVVIAAIALGPLDLRLKACARWPARAGCGQECVGQLPVR
jgi:hypothetical protein